MGVPRSAHVREARNREWLDTQLLRWTISPVAGCLHSIFGQFCLLLDYSHGHVQVAWDDIMDTEGWEPDLEEEPQDSGRVGDNAAHGPISSPAASSPTLPQASAGASALQHPAISASGRSSLQEERYPPEGPNVNTQMRIKPEDSEMFVTRSERPAPPHIRTTVGHPAVQHAAEGAGEAGVLRPSPGVPSPAPNSALAPGQGGDASHGRSRGPSAESQPSGEAFLRYATQTGQSHRDGSDSSSELQVAMPESIHSQQVAEQGGHAPTHPGQKGDVDAGTRAPGGGPAETAENRAYARGGEGWGQYDEEGGGQGQQSDFMDIDIGGPLPVPPDLNLEGFGDSPHPSDGARANPGVVGEAHVPAAGIPKIPCEQKRSEASAAPSPGCSLEGVEGSNTSARQPTQLFGGTPAAPNLLNKTLTFLEPKPSPSGDVLADGRNADRGASTSAVSTGAVALAQPTGKPPARAGSSQRAKAGPPRAKTAKVAGAGHATPAPSKQKQTARTSVAGKASQATPDASRSPSGRKRVSPGDASKARQAVKRPRLSTGQHESPGEDDRPLTELTELSWGKMKRRSNVPGTSEDRTWVYSQPDSTGLLVLADVAQAAGLHAGVRDPEEGRAQSPVAQAAVLQAEGRDNRDRRANLGESAGASLLTGQASKDSSRAGSLYSVLISSKKPKSQRVHLSELNMGFCWGFIIYEIRTFTVSLCLGVPGSPQLAVYSVCASICMPGGVSMCESMACADLFWNGLDGIDVADVSMYGAYESEIPHTETYPDNPPLGADVGL
jgi:hypothetical protein